jgi:hypothetical protein
MPVSRDFITLDLSRSPWESVRGELDKWITRLVSRLDAQDGRAGDPKFYNTIDMDGHAILNGPVQTDPAPQEFITRAYADQTYIVPRTSTAQRPTVVSNIRSVVFADSPYSFKGVDEMLLVDCTGGNILIGLPPVSAVQKGRQLTVKKVDSSGNTVTIKGDANIDGSATRVISIAYTSITVVTDSQRWWVR